MTCNSKSSSLLAGSLLCFVCLCLMQDLTLARSSSSVVSYPLVPHHAEKARRNLQIEDLERPARNDDSGNLLRRRTVEQQVGALFQGYGTHYVDLWCGSPPQRQTVIVDTGSSVTAFPCSECNDCGVPDHHIDALFDESKSTTYEPKTCTSNNDCTSYHSTCKTDHCEISQAYSEGSRYDAKEAVDRCYIGGPHEQPLVDDVDSDAIDPNFASHYAFDLDFGCQFHITNMFISQLADGIMGMNNGSGPYWKQMLEAGKLSEEQFALCYSRQPTAAREGTEAGALTMGGVDTRLHDTDMVYSSGAIIGRDRYWNVKIRKIFFRDGSAGERVVPTDKKATIIQLDLDNNHRDAIVDSGTTDTYLTKKLAASFTAVFEKLTGRKYSNTAWSLTEEELEAFPTIIFQLESTANDNPGKDPNTTPGLAGSFDEKNPYDVLVAVPPSHYMEYDPSEDKYTPRFYIEKSGDSGTLGANTMMGHDVLFDAENGRIGWAESSCDYTGLLSENGYDFSITGEMEEPIEEDTDADADVSDGEVDDSDESISTTSTDEEILDGDSDSDESNEALEMLDVTLDTESEIAENSARFSEKVGEDTIEVDCREEQIDRSQNVTWDRAKNETVVAYCKAKKGATEFLDFCDSPECYIPVIVGLVVALCAGVCLCPVLKCFFYYLFCCCCCDKKKADQGGSEVEMSSYRDEPGNEEEFVGQRDKKKYRDRTRAGKKKAQFNGDFNDFI